MKNPTLAYLFAISASLLGSLSAGVTNFDFQGRLFGTPGAVFSGQGALSDPGNNHWNAVNFDDTPSTFTTSTQFLESDGITLSPISLFMTSDYNYNQNLFGTDPRWASGYGDLLGDYLDGGGSPGQTLTILNLVPNAIYSLHLYGTSSDNPAGGSTFTVGAETLGTTPIGTNTGETHPLTQDADYVVFENIAASATGEISIGYTQHFSGFQLAAVPEPETPLILAASLAFVVAAVRRRSH